MVETRCVKKYRDKTNKITSYMLQSEDGVTRELLPYELKYLMLTEQVHVINLKLTSDERIVDDQSYKSQDSVRDRIYKLESRITQDTGIKFDNHLNTVRLSDKDFYIEATALGYGPLIKTGLKYNHNIIKIMYRERDSNVI